MKFPVLLFLIYMLAIVSVHAQSENIFGVETGLAIHNVQDLGHSPLIYKGQALFFGANYNREKENSISELKLSSSSAEVVPSVSASPNYKLNIGERQIVHGSYSWLKRKNFDQLQIAYGGSFAVLYDFITYNHSANNLVGYELNLSLNPTILLSYDLTEKFGVSLMGSIPLLGYNIRPNPSGLFPLKDLDVDMGAILSGGHLVTVNEVFSLHSRITASVTLWSRQFSFFYDFFGGINQMVQYKGFSLHKLGLQIPLNIKLR